MTSKRPGGGGPGPLRSDSRTHQLRPGSHSAGSGLNRAQTGAGLENGTGDLRAVQAPPPPASSQGTQLGEQPPGGHTFPPTEVELMTLKETEGAQGSKPKVATGSKAVT